MRMAQDTAFRAEWVDQSARGSEEAAWSWRMPSPRRSRENGRLGAGSRLAADRDGHVWTEIPEEESLALVSSRAPDPGGGARDAARTRGWPPLMASLRRPTAGGSRRQRWTASGAMRQSPWLEIHRANRESGGELERFVFNEIARGFRRRGPATGDVAVWTGLYAGGSTLRGHAAVSDALRARPRSRGGWSRGVALELDPRRYVAEALRDLGAGGRPLVRDGRGGARDPDDAARGRGARLERRRAGRAGRGAVAGAEAPRRTGAPRSERSRRSTSWTASRCASPRPGSARPDGCSSRASRARRWPRSAAEAARAFPPASYSGLKRDVLLLFALLVAAVFVAVGIVSRRISAPVGELVRAAEEIGRGRTVGSRRRGVPGRDRPPRRGHRQHGPARRAPRGDAAAPPPVLALRLPDDRRTGGPRPLDAGHRGVHQRRARLVPPLRPQHEPPRGRAAGLERPRGAGGEAEGVGGRPFDRRTWCSGPARRIARTTSTTTRTPTATCSTPSPRTTASSSPSRPRRRRSGVAVAINRPGGFGQEEIDAVTSFADLVLAPAAQRAALRDARARRSTSCGTRAGSRTTSCRT